jgi:hypothetical protein
VQVRATAGWGADIDVDEVLVAPPAGHAAGRADVSGGAPRVACEHTSGAEGSVARWLSRLPSRVAAVLLPRLRFGTNGRTSHPRHLTQMEAYTTRRRHTNPPDAGKVLFRPSLPGTAGPRLQSALFRGVLHSKHSVMVQGSHSALPPTPFSTQCGPMTE